MHIKYGEPQTHWRVVYFEHAFRVKDSKGQVLGEMTASRNEIFILGQQEPLEEEYAKPKDRTREFEQTDTYEHKRAAKVKRTYTEVSVLSVSFPLSFLLNVVNLSMCVCSTGTTKWQLH